MLTAGVARRTPTRSCRSILMNEQVICSYATVGMHQGVCMLAGDAWCVE